METALVTCAEWPELTPDDRLPLPDLRAAGLGPRAVRWDAEAAWDRFGAVVVRSPWDYTWRLGEFLRWVGDLERQGVALWNPAPVLRWNADKAYLLQMAKAGVPGVPTRHVPRGAQASLTGLLAEEGWEEAVVKPAVSAGGRDTWRVTRAQAAARQAAFEGLSTERGALVQPFLPEIQQGGEWGLVFLGGAFSHAVRKLPARGDFRVQEHFGGSQAAATPTPELVRQAEAALEAAQRLAGGHDLLYARVDGVVQGGVFRLMEMELLEPSLCFAQAPAMARRRFADALRARVQDR